MSPYPLHGFIGQEIVAWVEANKKAHKELFEEAEKLNNDCYRILGDLKINKNDLRQTVIACLFPRCMELFQATYILVARGMCPSANIIFRSLMETTFALCATAKDDEALEAYILNDELWRLKLTNKMLRHKGDTFAEISHEALQEINTELAKKIKGQKIKKFSTEEFSKRAGLHDWYVTAYASTSNAVHATIRDMEQYLEIDEKDDIKAIRFGPTDKDIHTILSVACWSLVRSLEQFLLVFGQDTRVCEEHAEILKPLMELK